jgi:hypothetical protein
MEKGAMNHGKQEASKSKKKQRNTFSPRGSRRNTDRQHLTSLLWDF